MKVFPLSSYSIIGWHLLLVKHRNAFRKIFVLRSGQISKWTAPVTRHVKIRLYGFFKYPFCVFYVEWSAKLEEES